MPTNSVSPDRRRRLALGASPRSGSGCAFRTAPVAMALLEVPRARPERGPAPRRPAFDQEGADCVLRRGRLLAPAQFARELVVGRRHRCETQGTRRGPGGGCRWPGSGPPGTPARTRIWQVLAHERPGCQQPPGARTADAWLRSFPACGREDSNLHPRRDRDLNPARLPVPPRPQRRGSTKRTWGQRVRP